MSPTLARQENVRIPPKQDFGGSSDGPEEFEDDEEDWSAGEQEGTEECETQHGDHLDTTTFENPFGNEWTADWHSCWYSKDERSFSNDHYYDNEVTQRWMRALSCVRRNSISVLVERRDRDGGCQIPLFKGTNGWEYSIGLDIGRMTLPSTRCPAVLGDSPHVAPSLFELKARSQDAVTSATGSAPPFPRFVVYLGVLGVRSDARYPQHFTVPTVLTETTDYKVVVDVDSDDMPLWILAPRSQQQLRLTGPYRSRPNPVHPLPMFNGLLENEDVGFDCACIIPSIRRLGVRPPGPGAPSYHEACELIQKTRAVIDPAALRLPVEKIANFNGGVSLQKLQGPFPSYADLPSCPPS
ncbi:hypothetical protein GQ53DRAFT_761036 [Thozetella sp. PMI_491]|nr:hypothetical protein GQ53DRAFT_761036 [Thozetella sp. PMI_491]